MGEAASVISAISALIAVLSLIIIHFQSRSLMRRIERPVISLDSTDVQRPLHTMHLELCFKNIGKNPAANILLRINGCRNQKSPKMENIDNKYIANQKDPGVSFFWTVDVSYKERTDFLFYIEITYQDMLTSKPYRNKFWLIYRKGESDLKDMDITGHFNSLDLPLVLYEEVYKYDRKKKQISGKIFRQQKRKDKKKRELK